MTEHELEQYLRTPSRSFFQAEWVIPLCFVLAGLLWLWWGQSIQPFAFNPYAYPWERP